VTRSTHDKKKYDKMRMLLKRKGITPGAFFNSLEGRDYDNLSDEEKISVFEKAVNPELSAKLIEEFRARQREYDKKRDQKRRDTSTAEGASAVDWKNAAQRAKNQLQKLFELSREEAVERFNQEIERRVSAGEDKIQAARSFYNDLTNQAVLKKLKDKFIKKIVTKKRFGIDEEKARQMVEGKSVDELREMLLEYKIDRPKKKVT